MHLNRRVHQDIAADPKSGDLSRKWVQLLATLPAGKEAEVYKYGAEQPSEKPPPP